MAQRMDIDSTVTIAAIAVTVTLLAWPVLIAIGTALGTVTGEAWQLDAWSQEPRRRLLATALQDWRHALPWSLGIALLAVLDRVLLGRWRTSAPLTGITLPLVGAVLAFLVWPEPFDALPTLALTGLVLAIAARLIGALTGRFA